MSRTAILVLLGAASLSASSIPGWIHEEKPATPAVDYSYFRSDAPCTRPPAPKARGKYEVPNQSTGCLPVAHSQVVVPTPAVDNNNVPIFVLDNGHTPFVPPVVITPEPPTVIFLLLGASLLFIKKFSLSSR